MRGASAGVSQTRMLAGRCEAKVRRRESLGKVMGHGFS